MWHWIELSGLKIKVSWAALPTAGWGRHLGVAEGNPRAEIPENVGLDYIANAKLGVN